MPKDKVSTFYLAQIDAIHAGKTMDIDLWDPGDTGNMTATLEILAPTGTGFMPVNFAYQGEMASEAAVSCNGQKSASAASVVTANGSSLFNGCWLTITVVLPLNYTAPIDPASGEAGWWKIRYTMSGGTTVDRHRPHHVAGQHPRQPRPPGAVAGDAPISRDQPGGASTMIRSSVMSSIAQRRPSRPSPESLTPP